MWKLMQLDTLLVDFLEFERSNLHLQLLNKGGSKCSKEAHKVKTKTV